MSMDTAEQYCKREQELLNVIDFMGELIKVESPDLLSASTKNKIADIVLNYYSLNQA